MLDRSYCGDVPGSAPDASSPCQWPSKTLQSRLLRVLQERVVTRVGYSREVPVDVLVICATHRNLQELMEKGEFREDLFYRLNGYSLDVPPLRERSDIRAIIRGLLRSWSGSGERASDNDNAQLITDEAMGSLARYSWPGNIRQLETVIRALLALRNSDAPIGVADLPSEVYRAAVAGSVKPAISQCARGDALEAAQIDAIQQALAKHRGNLSAAARALGVSRGTLYKRLRSTST